MLNPLARCVRSLFTRLALVLILAAVLLNIVTYQLFFRFQSDRETSFNRNLVEYANLLARELGSPPDRAKAAEMAARLGMRITFDAPDGWSEGTNASFPENKLRPWFATPTLEVASLHGFYRIRVQAGAGQTITFDSFPSKQEQAGLHRYGQIYLAATLSIMLAAYLLMRHLLRPVRWLTDAAAAVRDGDLSRRVPEKRGGELRDLARTFNQMLARLEGTVQAQQRLLLGVSHELRTPLTRLKLRVEMLGEQASPMREDLDEMEDMIKSLLDAARMRHEACALQREHTDLTELLRSVANRYQGSTPSITAMLPNHSVTAMVAPRAVATVLGNLLDNALKYSGPNAEIVALSLNVAKGKAIITVRDQGPGIPAEALPHLFEPFFRVDESRTRETGGYGLGLSLCQAIVQAHGGWIEVESETGQGATFTVQLPLHHP